MIINRSSSLYPLDSGGPDKRPRATCRCTDPESAYQLEAAAKEVQEFLAKRPELREPVRQVRAWLRGLLQEEEERKVWLRSSTDRVWRSAWALVKRETWDAKVEPPVDEALIEAAVRDQVPHWVQVRVAYFCTTFPNWGQSLAKAEAERRRVMGMDERGKKF